MRKSAKYKEKPPLLSGKSAAGSNPVAEAKKERPGNPCNCKGSRPLFGSIPVDMGERGSGAPGRAAKCYQRRPVRYPVQRGEAGPGWEIFSLVAQRYATLRWEIGGDERENPGRLTFIYRVGEAP